MKSHVAQTTKGPIEYTMLGSGPMVFVCHGTSSDCFSTELADPLIGAGFSILTPSRPGYGRTPITGGQSATEAAAGLVALLDALQVQKCAVLAISGGGPTGAALAAMYPDRVTRLVLAAAITHPEDRPNDPAYKNQVAFYGPSHRVVWAMLSLLSRISPRSMARQTLAIFSSHDSADALIQLSTSDIQKICRFYQGRSSRKGALNDLTHTLGTDTLKEICQPTLVIHSREDKSVPFAHAEWSLRHIPQAVLCETGITGHFFWVGPDYGSTCKQLVAFLKEGDQKGA